MKSTVFGTSDSTPVMLPQKVLDALSIGEGAEVLIEANVESGQIVLTFPSNKVTDGSDRSNEAFVRQVEEFIERYDTALRNLAKGPAYRG